MTRVEKYRITRFTGLESFNFSLEGKRVRISKLADERRMHLILNSVASRRLMNTCAEVRCAVKPVLAQVGAN